MSSARFRVECVDRESGKTFHHFFEADSSEAASNLASKLGYIVGVTTRVDNDPFAELRNAVVRPKRSPQSARTNAARFRRIVAYGILTFMVASPTIAVFVDDDLFAFKTNGPGFRFLSDNAVGASANAIEKHLPSVVALLNSIRWQIIGLAIIIVVCVRPNLPAPSN